ncbi:MAG: hypothetical protein ACE5DI_04145 [Candidatus Micrarchaeia archaeon]
MGLKGVLRERIVVLILLFLALLLVFTFFLSPSLPKNLSQQDAWDLVLNDVQVYKQQKYPAQTASFELVRADALSDGRWRALVDIAVNEHSSCPKVERLEYELMPIVITRSEMLVADCLEHPVNRREQALINSAKSGRLSGFVTEGAVGCAFKLPFDFDSDREYCPFADFNKLNLFASQNNLQNGYWIVLWVKGARERLLAFNPLGEEAAYLE